MATIFSETLVRLRREAGFTTAYHFFNSNGGKSRLGISYRGYLLLEQGKSLPSFGRMRTFILSLHITLKSRTANELVVSWLKTFFDKESFEDLVFPVFSENSGLQALSPTQQALKRTLVQTTMFVSPKQLSVISENKDIYACFLLASAETGILTPKIIADASGMSVASAEKAMKRLAAVKALKAVKPGQYKCPFAGKMVEFPQLMTVPDIRKNLENIQDELIASGKPMYSRRGIIRADTLAIADFFPVLSLNTAAAQAYAITNKTENSAIFAVDCRVTKILDF